MHLTRPRVNYVCLIESTAKIYVLPYCRHSVSAYLVPARRVQPSFGSARPARDRGPIVSSASFPRGSVLTFGTKHGAAVRVRRKLFEKSPHRTSAPILDTELLLFLPDCSIIPVFLPPPTFLSHRFLVSPPFKPDCQNDLCLSSFRRNIERRHEPPPLPPLPHSDSNCFRS